jgi:hypothetical protein
VDGQKSDVMSDTAPQNTCELRDDGNMMLQCCKHCKLSSYKLALLQLAVLQRRKLQLTTL